MKSQQDVNYGFMETEVKDTNSGGRQDMSTVGVSQQLAANTVMSLRAMNSQSLHVLPPNNAHRSMTFHRILCPTQMSLLESSTMQLLASSH